LSPKNTEIGESRTYESRRTHGDNGNCQKADAVSVEAGAPPGGDREARGLGAIRAKSDWWLSNHEIHSATVGGPWPHDDRFIVAFRYDVTHKPSGQRMTMDEVGLYYVRGGKIVKEEFFYSMGT
jgi:hypothetical protein